MHESYRMPRIVVDPDPLPAHRKRMSLGLRIGILILGLLLAVGLLELLHSGTAAFLLSLIKTVAMAFWSMFCSIAAACRDFMVKRLGMKCRKMGVIPSKADPDKQKEFLHNALEPLLEEEKQGKRRVFFVDAAHFVMGAFLGMLWCFERLFLKSSSGRKRYNVLGAYSVKGAEAITVTNNTYINSDTIVELLNTIKRLYPDAPITLVMDNARYQRCVKVMEMADKLGIDLLFLPPYSPNLNLIERLWKFTKKQCLYNRYYETFHEFKAAIDDCLDQVGTTFSEQVKTLLNPKFQLFKNPFTINRVQGFLTGLNRS